MRLLNFDLDRHACLEHENRVDYPIIRRLVAHVRKKSRTLYVYMQGNFPKRAQVSLVVPCIRHTDPSMRVGAICGLYILIALSRVCTYYY